MDEKKIFLAYTYRALDLLYRHLYTIKASAIFDNMYDSDVERQCACKDVMATPLSSLALHFYIEQAIEERYTSCKKLNKYLHDAISLLLNNQTPDIILATCASLYNPYYDRYNPIFTNNNQ